MNSLKKVLAILLTMLLILSFSACNKDDDDEAVLTTKKKVTTTHSDGSDIDIWAYLENGDLEDTLAEEAGTIAYSSGGSYSSQTYEDVPVSFGGTSVFSSATTAKSGYPTFKWNAVSGAIKYNIYRSTSKNGTYTYLDTTTATSYTDKTAVSGTQYYYQVKAVKKVDSTKSTTKKSSGTTKSTQNPTQSQTVNFNPPARDASSAPKSAPQTFTSVSDIVALYNLAANNVITKATAVARTNRVIQELEYDTGSTAAGLSTSLLKNWLGIANGPSINSTVKVFTGAQAQEEFPSDTYTDTASKLTTSMVRSANCTYQDGYYNVTIVLKDDPEYTSEYSQTCLNVLHPSTIYSGATAQAKAIQVETESKAYAPMLQAQIWYDGYQLDYVIDQVPTILAIRADEGDVTVNTSLAILMLERWAVQY
ncbi:MAG: hypothetical protein Q4F70_03460 [Clostridia bacterium]|nr:hypothetical protein [Clostridia bacterium]